MLKDYKLKQMLKEYTPQQVINKHIRNEITLSNKQLNYLIEQKNKIIFKKKTIEDLIIDTMGE